MVPSMHCSITLFIVTIVEVHVLIYDDFVCYWSLTFCVFLTGSTLLLILHCRFIQQMFYWRNTIVASNDMSEPGISF